jgi:hypothetical protein
MHHKKLISSDGFVNREAFYNYLTAWYNVEQMNYYVSQGSFQPVPPTWKFVHNATNR